jgi:hypothetical protein
MSNPGAPNIDSGVFTLYGLKKTWVTYN